MPSRMYFKQLAPGKDIALGSEAKGPIEQMVFSFAKQMANFIYLVGDADTRECVVVDGCWDVDGIKKRAGEDGMKIVGAVATHYHFDHVGGEPPSPFNQLGIGLPGMKELVSSLSVPAYIHESEVSRYREEKANFAIDLG